MSCTDRRQAIQGTRGTHSDPGGSVRTFRSRMTALIAAAIAIAASGTLINIPAASAVEGVPDGKSGVVLTWGLDNAGQTKVPAGLTDVTAISGDGFFTLALKGNGTVVGWGSNDYGQITVPAGLSGVDRKSVV